MCRRGPPPPLGLAGTSSLGNSKKSPRSSYDCSIPFNLFLFPFSLSLLITLISSFPTPSKLLKNITFVRFNFSTTSSFVSLRPRCGEVDATGGEDDSLGDCIVVSVVLPTRKAVESVGRLLNSRSSLICVVNVRLLRIS